MKSNYTMDSKYRCEGRINLPRRRVATKTCSENGDFEMELSLAIRESLKYARENELKLKQKERMSPLLNGAQQDESFPSCMAEKMLNFASNCENNKGQGHGCDEVQQLKELLLIHIELIQQQQELLTNKDKEIVTLKNEKDTLLWRLQKAEKRIAHMKQKEDLLEKQIADVQDLAAAPEVAAPSGPAEKNKEEKLEKTPGRKRKRPQQNKAVPPSKIKRFNAEAVKTSESATFEEQGSDSEVGDIEEEEEEVENEESDGKKSESSISHQELQGTSNEEEGDREESEETEAKEEEEEEDKDPYPQPVLRTEHLYHVTCCVEQEPEEVDVSEDTSEKDVVTGDQVETPGWRINVVTNRYQLEGTENITDEAYQKRHQKHELEEKRRKRWDIQRLREQRVFEKLRGKEKAATSSAENFETDKSFLPSIDDITHLEISDSVPVMAFGHAVPNVQPSEFELPWDTSPFIRKSYGGRGRQK